MAKISRRVLLYKALASALERLPERLDVWLGSTIARGAGRRLKQPAAHLRENIRHIATTPSTPIDEQLLDRFVQRGFANYGRYWVEGAKLPALSRRTIDDRFVVSEGREHLEAGRARGKGLIVALPHVGSWEWGGSFLSHVGLGMTCVAEMLDPPELFAWFATKRRQIGIEIEPLDDHAGTVMLRTLKSGGVVGLLCDRDIQGNGIEVTFFGETVTMPAGPATLALRTGATLVAASCYAGPGRGHHAVVTPPIEAVREGALRTDVQRVTQAVTTQLEGLIRRAPEQWHVLQPRFSDFSS